MRRLALAALVLLASCTSAPSEDELKSMQELQVAANKVVEDQRDDDALDGAEAWLEANKRQELDAYAAKHEAAPVERLRKIITATRALEDLRFVIREERRRASVVAAASVMLQDPATGDAERGELVTRLSELRLMLRVDRREKQTALDRWQKARAALGAEAFGGKPK